VECWQAGYQWIFRGGTKAEHAQLVQLCRQLMGKSHGHVSSWWSGHVLNPKTDNFVLVPAVIVRDQNLAAMLKLMWC